MSNPDDHDAAPSSACGYERPLWWCECVPERGHGFRHGWITQDNGKPLLLLECIDCGATRRWKDLRTHPDNVAVDYTNPTPAQQAQVEREIEAEEPVVLMDGCGVVRTVHRSELAPEALANERKRFWQGIADRAYPQPEPIATQRPTPAVATPQDQQPTEREAKPEQADLFGGMADDQQPGVTPGPSTTKTEGMAREEAHRSRV